MTCEQAYQQYGGYIYAVCRRAVSDPDVAADLAHDTWLGAVQAWARTAPADETVLLWLIVIARNRCRMYWRARYTEQRRVGVLRPYDPQTDDRWVAGPDVTIVAAEEHATIARAVGRLSCPQRRAIGLRAAGYDQYAIAARLGRNPNAIKQLLWRARQHLRQQLEA